MVHRRAEARGSYIQQREHPPMRALPAVLAFTAVALLSTQLRGQSAQPYSLQLEVLGTTIDFGGQNISGIGVEPQLRANRLWRSEAGVLSAGLGFQYTRHTSGSDHFDITGVFLEPRYAFAGNREQWFPYLALRAAILHQGSNFGSGSTGSAFGGGGGFVYAFSRAVNFDVGAAVVRQSFSDDKFEATGQPFGFEPFWGYAIKAGLSFGFGS
jgi:hypothetical protein